MTNETGNNNGQAPSILSPALAAIAAWLSMPKQYAAIMSETVINMNTQCPTAVFRIDK